MGRITRVVVPGYSHHVLQCGNYHQTVFEEDADYRRYLEMLGECTVKFGLSIWAYCLMSNHIHFVCVPREADSLAKALNTLHMRYSQYFNHKKGRHGHLWQGRFYSSILDDRHAFEAIRYIENNPVRQNLVDKAHLYPWSSARSHVFGDENPLLKNKSEVIKNITDWPAYLQEKGEDALVDDIRRSMKTGRPCGDLNFIHTLEALLHRRLIPNPRGRPHKRQP